MAEEITFVASFPAIQSAIKITGDGGGMRIQLDIPENQMAEAIKLMLYRQCAIQVTVKPYEQPQIQQVKTTSADSGAKQPRTVKRTAAKRRK